MIKLRKNQLELVPKAVETLQRYNLVYINAEVRTGKTIMSLETARRCNFKNVLFCSKKSALNSIKKDYEHFKECFKLTLINYESLHKINGDFDLIIVDEAHRLGAFPKKVLAIERIKKIVKDKPIIFLSATPSPESYSQLFHQFYVSSFSEFSEYKNFYAWAKEFVHIQKKNIRRGLVINDYSKAHIDKIDEIISKYMLSQSQEQAGFKVSEIHEITHTVPTPDKIKRLFKCMINNDYITINDVDIAVESAAEKKSKALQLASGTIITKDKQYIIVDDFKAQYIKNCFKGKKIAIFYKYKNEFELLKKVFENWTEDQDKFNNSKDLVFLGQFVSKREGVKLNTADDLIFFNIDYAALSYLQGKGRIQDFERKNVALLHWIFSETGLEEEIYRRVIEKKDFTMYYFKKYFLR